MWAQGANPLPRQLGLRCHATEEEESQPCIAANTHARFGPRTPNGLPLNDTLPIANLAARPMPQA